MTALTCEQERDVLRLRVTELEQDYALIDKELRKTRKTVQALTNQLADKHRQSPRAKDVLEVIEHYVSELQHPRMVVCADDTKADAVRKAFGWGFTVEQLKQAVDGLARYPYVWASPGESFPRRRRYGLRGSRRDNLVWLLADSDRVQKFIDRGLEGVPEGRVVSVPGRVLDRMHERDAIAAAALAWYREQSSRDAALIAGLTARVDELGGPVLRLVPGEAA